jgi:hypothetical protein
MQKIKHRITPRRLGVIAGWEIDDHFAVHSQRGTVKGRVNARDIAGWDGIGS